MKTIFFAFLLFAFSLVALTKGACVGSKLIRANPPPDVPCAVNCTLGVCGNGICEKLPAELSEENCENCPADCGVCPTCAGVCGNHRCESDLGETACNCLEDCPGCCEDGICGPGENFKRCPTDCAGNIYGEVYPITLAPAEVQAVSNGSFAVECTSHLSQAQGIRLQALTVNGQFSFFGLIFDEYTCCVAGGANYINNCQTVNLGTSSSAPSNLTIRIPLKTKISSITVRVVENGKGWLRAANVSCTAASGLELTAATAPDGTAHFFDVKANSYVCTAKNMGYNTSSVAFTLATGDSPFFTLSLAPRSSNIVGQVQNIEGAGIMAQSVACTASSLNGGAVNTTAIDNTGRFQILNITRGEYSCIARAAGFLGGVVRLSVAPGTNATAIFYLRRAYGALAGTIQTAATSQPVAGAVVTCVYPPYISLKQTSDASGKVSFVGLIPASYSCTIQKNGFAAGNTTVAVGAGGSASFAVLL
eukprot:TRINITY_DN112_c0_g1_i1.p1 TRINITY_DN112_c0_g1~~TRINITY_DN112_c0_g1_i1.p1  ORF type:complete len:477 (-),score=178.44 TRINITY_DN112_c0_g1_i1:218-1648(-)